MSVRTGVDEYNQPTSDINSGYIGEFKYFGFESVPPHCLACDGSEVSRETYSELFEVFGTMYGAGDGTNTFNLPDFRGYFLRGANGTNSAAMGTAQTDAIRNITGGLPGLWGRGGSNVGAFSVNIVQNAHLAAGSGGGTWLDADMDVSRVVSTAAEVRPINYAVNICVVYE